MNKFKYKNKNGKIVLMTHNITCYQFSMLFFYFKIHQTIFINHPETYILGKDLEMAQTSLDT